MTPGQTSPPGPTRARTSSGATREAVEEAWSALTARGDGSGPWWPDVVIVILAALIGVVAGAAMGPWGLLIGLLQVAPLPWRRSRPALVALVVAAGCLLQVAVTDEPHPANIVVPLVVYSAAAFGDRRTSRAVLALGLFGAVLATLDWRLRYGGFWDLNLGSMLFNAAFLAMFVGVAWGLGDVVRRRRAVLARLDQQNRALARDQAQRAQLAAQGERAAIAREMHDVVAHSLAVVVVQADGGLYAARQALEAAPAIAADRAALERAAGTLETLAQTARESLAETRKLVGVLRDEGASAEYAPLQGLAYLDDLAQRIRDSGIPVDVVLRGDVDDLPQDVDLAAYRVVQEALTNVLKHAGPGATVDVDVLRTPAVLVVRVTDDGTGPDESADGEGNGILGMAERVEVLGGTVHAGPRARGGWEVVASIPTEGVGPDRGDGNGIPSGATPPQTPRGDR